MRRRYITLDVFTAKRFCGNPLAVVFDPQGLDGAAMQAIAREFNYPETIFVLPPQNPTHRARLRIFTPAAELPFAGHPTVGGALALARSSAGQGTQRFVVEEQVGLVVCEVTMKSADHGHASFVIPQLPAEAEPAPPKDALAAGLGLAAADIATDLLPPSRWSAGLPFTFVPVADLAAIGRARPDPVRFEQVFAIGGPAKVFLFCRGGVDGGDFHARMFAPKMGIPEDPATGSAAAAFMGLYAAHSKPMDGIHRLRIEQGYQMGRPSQIELAMTVESGKLTSGSIGGDAIVVTEGVIEAAPVLGEHGSHADGKGVD